MNRPSKSGYYWVRLKCRVTIDEWNAPWEIMYYDKDDDVFTRCGDEIEINPNRVLDISHERLKQIRRLNHEMLPAVVALAEVVHELSVRVTGGGFTVPIAFPNDPREFDSRSCPPGKVQFHSEEP